MNSMLEHLDYDEESFKEKAKRKVGVFTMVGSGLLAIIHTLSHIVPAVAVLGFALGEGNPLYNLVTNEYMQLAFIPFVGLSFYYMYRDHKHHKHEKELRRELAEVKAHLKEFEKGKK